MKKTSIRDRIRYWFDNEIAKGTGNMVRMLLLATILITVLGTMILCLLDSEASWHVTLWNNMTTAINAWMPEIDDSGEIFWPGYIIGALVAIAGLFITSTLIGIISTGLEDKLEELRGGKRKLLESGHLVILGEENCDLCLNSAVKILSGVENCSILIADKMDPERLDEVNSLRNDLPKNIELYVRNMDITDPDALELCSVGEASSVLIHSSDENKTVKAVLAASALLQEYPESKVHVVTGVSSPKRRLPEDTVDPRISMIPLGDFMARLIVVSCANPEAGIVLGAVLKSKAAVLKQGSIPDTVGLDFEKLTECTSGATPFGIVRDGNVLLIPEPGLTVRDTDKLLYFHSVDRKIELIEPSGEKRSVSLSGKKTRERVRKLVIIGSNSTVPEIIRCLPASFWQVVLVPGNREEEALQSMIAAKFGDHIRVERTNVFDDGALRKLVADTDHVVLLNRDLEGEPAEGEDDERDTDNAVILKRLQSLREQEKLSYYVTAEFIHKEWTVLVRPTEYINVICKELIKPVLTAQAALNPDSGKVLLQLLSGSHHGISVVPAGEYGCTGREFTFRELRSLCYQQKAIAVGYIISRGGNKRLVLNSPLEEKVELTEEDSLVLIR